MSILQIKAGPGQWTDHGKRSIALAMVHRGEHSVGAAVLLEQNGGNGYVWRHLLCQGVELVLKGSLLLRDYDQYEPELKKLGHRLVDLADKCAEVFGVHPPRGPLRDELSKIAALYQRHDLRYASGLDILVDPDTIAIERISRRLLAVFRLVRRAVRRNELVP